MIKKIYRLKESEVKKVLRFSKPFFSYNIVLNTYNNKLSHNRFAIIISSKSVENACHRVFFRRLFFNTCSKYIYWNNSKDFVFVVKKQIKLDKKDINSINSFKKDLLFLISKNF